METGSEGFEIEKAAIGIQQQTQMSGYGQVVVRYGAESRRFFCVVLLYRKTTCRHFYNYIYHFSKLQSSIYFPPNYLYPQLCICKEF